MLNWKQSLSGVSTSLLASCFLTIALSSAGCSQDKGNDLTEISTPPLFVATDSDFSTKVLANNSPVVVFFWAEWSGTSKMMIPTIEEVSEMYAGKVKIAKVNIDENDKTTEAYKVKGLPTLMLFSKGNPIASKLGPLSKDAFTKWIEGRLDNKT